MSDLIFAVAFIAMVAAPAMVATLGGRKEYNPDPSAESEEEADLFTGPRPPKRPSERVIRPYSAQKSALHDRGTIISDDVTLPMHNGRGMSNR